MVYDTGTTNYGANPPASSVRVALKAAERRDLHKLTGHRELQRLKLQRPSGQQTNHRQLTTNNYLEVILARFGTSGVAKRQRVAA